MPWIDTFDAHWLSWLEERHEACAPASLLLLLDGVFVPGLYARMRTAVGAPGDCDAVFQHLGSYSDAARSVTPFVVRFDPSNRSIARLVRECDANPMVSCIETAETPAQWAERLSRWCVVDIGTSAFNFRLADTRRLPAIARTLRPAQQRSMLGPATAWHCIDRTGRWQALPLPPHDVADSGEAPGRLDDAQFAALVQDSEADEMLSVLDARTGGSPVEIVPSKRSETAEAALRRADADGIRTTVDRLQRVDDALRQ